MPDSIRRHRPVLRQSDDGNTAYALLRLICIKTSSVSARIMSAVRPLMDRSMTALSFLEIEALRRRLRLRRRELLAALRGEGDSVAGVHPAEERGVETHRDESAARVASDDVRFALARHDFEELRQIDDALVRIRARRYGLCIDCGNPIAYERLAAAPYAARCIACQMRHDERHATR